jgi:hypothetical protein
MNHLAKFIIIEKKNVPFISTPPPPAPAQLGGAAAGEEKVECEKCIVKIFTIFRTL